MTINEIAVLIGGALLGYWIVSSMLWSKKDGVTARRDDGVDANSSWGSREGSEPPGPESSSSRNDEGTERNWFVILEIAETASNSEITAAYKKMMSQYHPDKVATLGQELQLLAERKSKQINAAYDYAMKRRA